MATRVLPSVPDAAAWSALRVDETIYRAALAAIGVRHGLDTMGATRSSRGSLPVHLTHELAVKLFPPPYFDEVAIERTALERVHGRLSVRTPAVHATGELDGWGYLVSERLPGEALRELLPGLSAEARASIARQAGELLASLHRVPATDLPTLTPEWPRFMDERLAAVRDFQRGRGLAEAALGRLSELFERAGPLIPDDRRALLHADLHHEHLLCEPEGDGWRLTGVIDFGDAVVGHPEYDLIAPAFFIAGDSPSALRALFEGAGFRCDEAASLRLMAWSALHRFNALARFLPEDHGADALEALRARYWPVLAS